jgi:antitoxin (DNA-binding transcriptional repressor) of toxin-antitoxin stability system
MNVKTFAARELIKNFGAVTNIVSSGESVRVTKHGRTAYFIIPPTEVSEDFLRRQAVTRFVTIMNEARPTIAAQALSDDELTDLVNANR